MKSLNPSGFLMKLKVSLLLIALVMGCATKKSNCPAYPIPTENVSEKLDNIAQTDREVWEWLNKLSYLQDELDSCE